MDSSSAYGGRFDFETVICEILRVEFDLAGSSLDPTVEEAKKLIFAFNGWMATRGQDAVPVLSLPSTLRPATRETLFHERTHFWQLISSPLQQWAFMLRLSRLHEQTRAAGGDVSLICRPFFKRDVPATSMRRSLAIAEASFSARSITPEMVILDNFLPGTGGMGMPYLALPIDGFPNESVAGFGAAFENLGTLKQVVFPFTASYLMEAAAHISGTLHGKGEVPGLASEGEKIDIVYRGAWEFWRRLKSLEYDDPVDLSLAFLALIDLAQVSNPLLTSKSPDAHHLENAVPFRFGKLAISAPRFSLVSTKGDVAAAVAGFQDACCSLLGWPKPAIATWEFAKFITLTLLNSHGPSINWDPSLAKRAQEWTELYPSIVTNDAELEDQMSRTRPMWDLLRHNRGAAIAPPLGQEILGVMLNACVFRIRHPGVFAVPHLYSEQLSQAFPLPVVVSGGNYYYDPEVGETIRDPYPVKAAELLHECFGLLSLFPFTRGRPICGFLEQSVNCWYINAGLGCPQGEEDPAEIERRQAARIDREWCHWSRWNVHLRLAPRPLLDKWLEMWNKVDHHAEARDEEYKG